MREKTVACACFLCLCFGFSAFSIGLESATVSIDGIVHTISVERLEDVSPIRIVKDEFIPSGEISRIAVLATLTESHHLKCLVLNIVGPSDFILSGEVEFSFPSGAKLSMFGKAVMRNLTNGAAEGSVTFLQRLDDLKTSLGSPRDDSVVIAEIFSKRGHSESFRIPESFFQRLLPQ